MMVDGKNLMMYVHETRRIDVRWFEEFSNLFETWKSQRIARQDKLYEFYHCCEQLERKLDLLKDDSHLDLPLYEDMMREQLFRLDDLEHYHRAISVIGAVNLLESQFYARLHRKMEKFAEVVEQHYADYPGRCMTVSSWRWFVILQMSSMTLPGVWNSTSLG